MDDRAGPLGCAQARSVTDDDWVTAISAWSPPRRALSEPRDRTAARSILPGNVSGQLLDGNRDVRTRGVVDSVENSTEAVVLPTKCKPFPGPGAASMATIVCIVTWRLQPIRSSTVTSSASASLRRVATDPVLRPVSISVTVTRFSPALSARAAWVRPRRSR